MKRTKYVVAIVMAILVTVLVLTACQEIDTRRTLPTETEWAAFGLDINVFKFPKSLIIKETKVVNKASETEERMIYIHCSDAEPTDFSVLIEAIAAAVEDSDCAPARFEFEFGYSYTSSFSTSDNVYDIDADYYILTYEKENVKIPSGTLYFRVTEHTGEKPQDGIEAYKLFDRDTLPNSLEYGNVGLESSEVTLTDVEVAGVDINSHIIKNNSKILILLKSATPQLFNQISEGAYLAFANRIDGYMTDDIGLLINEANDVSTFKADYSKDGKKGYELVVSYYSNMTVQGGRIIIPAKTITIRFREVSDYVLKNYFYRDNIATAYDGTELPGGIDWATPGLVNVLADGYTVGGVNYTPAVGEDTLALHILLLDATDVKFASLAPKLNQLFQFRDEDGNTINLTELITDSDDGKTSTFLGYYTKEGYSFVATFVYIKQENSDERYLYPKGAILVSFVQV
ncbi:MAG: hypothetical protein LBE09_05495 [Christensenellaceae bacterium]|jgi:hypothetical protein|nr:hypothetical protein [Christensenellaceae bacterium]